MLGRAARLAMTLSALLTACVDVGDGLLTGASLSVPDCARQGEVTTLSPFNLRLRHVAINHGGTGATVRLSSSAAEAWRIDQVVFTIPVADRLAQEIATADGPVRFELEALPETPPGSTRLNLALMRTCQNRSASLEGRGLLEIDAWGTASGDRVAGRFSVDLIDPRTGEVRGAGFHGEFDLLVDLGTPFNAFAPTHY